jgi:hypothetical protein
LKEKSTSKKSKKKVSEIYACNIVIFKKKYNQQMHWIRIPIGGEISRGRPEEP